MTTGVYREPSDYSDEPYPITRALIEDGDKHLFGDRLIEAGCPVHILQGMRRHRRAVAARRRSSSRASPPTTWC